MTKITTYLLAVLMAFTYACNNSTNNDNEAIEVGSDDTVVTAKVDSSPIADTVEQIAVKQPEEVQINYNDSLDFERYKVTPEKITKHAPINWKSYPGAKDFRTRIIDAYKTDEVDFAGYYVTAVFGCGAGCIMGFMVDVRDGEIYDLPLGEENSCLFAENRAMGNKTSRLFIAGVCKENMEAKKVYYKAFLWNEEKKEFEKVEAAAFLKTK